VAGRDPPKTMTLGRKRKLIDDVRREWQVSIRRICAALKFDSPTKPQITWIRPGKP